MDQPKKTFLVVDDEPLLLEVLAADLTESGYGALTANGVKEGILTLKQEKVDYILSDIRLADESGLELLKYARENHPTIPVILMSGFSDVTPEKARELGALGLVDKPLELETIEAMLPR